MCFFTIYFFALRAGLEPTNSGVITIALSRRTMKLHMVIGRAVYPTYQIPIKGVPGTFSGRQ